MLVATSFHPIVLRSAMPGYGIRSVKGELSASQLFLLQGQLGLLCQFQLALVLVEGGERKSGDARSSLKGW